MIDPDKYGIELGDGVRISIIAEGEVVEGWDPVMLKENGGLYVAGLFLSEPGPRYTGPQPTVEILEKADPKWWSAQVIKADVRDVTGDFGPERGVHLLNQGGEYWCGTEGDPHRDLLFNVEVIVQ